MGDKLLFKAFATLLGCIFLTVGVHSFRPPKCRGKEVLITPEEMETVEICVKEYTTGGSASMGDLPFTRIACVGKCILKRHGLADSKGVPVKDNIFKMVNGTLDTEVADLANEKLGHCIDENASRIDVREKACKTYWPLVKCVIAAFTEICADPVAATAMTTEST